jgi:hypothetical protein
VAAHLSTGGRGEEVEVTSRRTQQFEFRVCQLQRGRMTIVNGEWIGTGKMDPNRAEAAPASCPWKWDYLGQAGEMAGISWPSSKQPARR